MISPLRAVLDAQGHPKDYRTKVHPRGRDDLPLTGVLASHGRTHPNPVGLVELFGERPISLKYDGWMTTTA
jgi:tRNA (Thr-GGU) A37 N-methylase